jgi:hypothetical protein
LRKKINRAILKLIESGELERIRLKWMGIKAAVGEKNKNCGPSFRARSLKVDYRLATLFHGTKMTSSLLHHLSPPPLSG